MFSELFSSAGLFIVYLFQNTGLFVVSLRISAVIPSSAAALSLGESLAARFQGSKLRGMDESFELCYQEPLATDVLTPLFFLVPPTRVFAAWPRSDEMVHEQPVNVSAVRFVSYAV
jgi:hypothetical protein